MASCETEVGDYCSSFPFQPAVEGFLCQGAANTPKLESPAGLLSVEFLLITLGKKESVLPLKVRICE